MACVNKFLVFVLFICTMLRFVRTETVQESSVQQKNGIFRSLRQKRSTNYFIDVMPVVDYKLYQTWLTRSNDNQAQAESDLTDYLTQIFTTVNQRIGTITSGDGQSSMKLVVTMVAPFIAKTQADSAFMGDSVTTESDGHKVANATELLGAFRAWVGAQTTLTPSDHLMLFTGYPLHSTTDRGGSFNITTGIGNLASLCKGELSVSVVGDKGAYQSETVATHELGHSLGALHDGESNSCKSPDRYVMTDNFGYGNTLENQLNPWRFSTCSSEAIVEYIRTLEADGSLKDCLNHGEGATLSANVKQMNHPNDICQTFYGSESYVCRGVNIPGINQICGTFYCRQPGTDMCVKLIAPTGTCCGNNRACMMGLCLDLSDTQQCVMDEVCPFGDQPGIVVSGKTCQQLDPYHCYDAAIRAKCCSTCESRKVNQEGCIYGDKKSGCVKTSCGIDTEEGRMYEFLCCHTCENVNCVDNSEINGQTCTEYISSDEYGISNCYNGDVNKGCCDTCEKSRRKSNPDCPFGDNTSKIQCNSLVNATRDCTPEEETVCCETCAEKEALTVSRPGGEDGSSSSTQSSTTDGTNQPNGRGGNGVDFMKPSLTMVFLSSLVLSAVLCSN